MNKWNEKLQFIRAFNKKIKKISELLQNFKIEGIDLRLSVMIQFLKCKEFHERMEHTSNIILSIFDLGIWLNEKNLLDKFNKGIRIKNFDNLQNFLKDLEKKMSDLKILHYGNQERFLGFKSVIRLYDSIELFIFKLIDFMKMIDKNYEDINQKLNKAFHKYQHKVYLSDYLESVCMKLEEFNNAFVTSTHELEQFIDSDHNNTHIKSSISLSDSNYIIKILYSFREEVLMKDGSRLSQISINVREFEEFIQSIKENFIRKDILSEKVYKNLDKLNTSHLQNESDTCARFIAKMNEFISYEEVSPRIGLKESLTYSLNSLQYCKKVLDMFIVIYTKGEKYLKILEDLLWKNEITRIAERLNIFEIELYDIINVLSKVYEESKNLKIFEDYEYEISLEKVIKDEVISFYIDNLQWKNEICISLQTMLDFYDELKEKFESKGIFINEDWIKFIRKYINIDINLFKWNIASIKNIKTVNDRMETFITTFNYTYAIKKRKEISDVLDNICYINETFLTDWFFSSKDVINVNNRIKIEGFCDKILLKVDRLQRKMCKQKLTLDKISHKLNKLHDKLYRIKDALKFLNDKDTIKSAGFKEIDRLNFIEGYFVNTKMDNWRYIIQILIEKVFIIEILRKIKVVYLDENHFVEFIEQNICGTVNEFQKSFLMASWFVISQLNI